MNSNVFTDIDKRLIVLSDDLTDFTTGLISFTILQIISDDDKNEASIRNFKREPIHLYINSHGGYVNDTFGLVSIIEKSKTPIYTYCTGYAKSAAFNLFISGHKRFLYNNAFFMIHQMKSNYNGLYNSILDTTEALIKLNEKWIDFVTTHTKITKKTLNDINTKNTQKYIYPNEAISLGIADEII